MNIIDQLRNTVNQFADSVVSLVSTVIPWFVPLIPAYIFYSHLMEDFSFPRWLALVGGSVVEGLGLSAVHQFFVFERHNRKYKDDKNKMPAWTVILAYLWYLVMILFVNVVLDWVAGVGWTRIVALTAFSTLSIPASLLISVHALHSDWKDEHERSLARSREQRKVQKRSPEPKPEPTEQKDIRPSDREQEIISYLNTIYKNEQRIPGPTEIARALELDPIKAKGYISGKAKEWYNSLEKNGAST